MADPTEEDPAEPAPEGDIPPLRAPYLPWALLPAPLLPSAVPFFLQWPAPEPEPPPPPTSGLAETGTVSAQEGAAEQFKDHPARFLTNDEATAVLLDLKRQNMLTWKPRKILGLPSMPDGGIVGNFKVRKPPPPDAPPRTPPGPLVDFAYRHEMECDPRLAVLLYRLAEYLYSEHDVTGMSVGIQRESGRAELSCHNQGRAVDVFSVTWGSEVLSVDQCWGALPFRVNGQVACQWNSQTKEFDKGDPVLGFRAIENLIKSVGDSGPAAKKLRQERLNPDIEVDAAVYRSVLGETDPGPPEGWSADTRAKADALQVKLRKAAKVFLGMFDFFVRETTLTGGASAFAKEQVTKLGQKEISRTNSGNMCIPDGTAWGGHQNHFHVQIGLTGWQEEVRSTEEQHPNQIDATVKTFLYGRIEKKIIGVLRAFAAKHEKAAADEKVKFEKKKVNKQIPEDALWTDDPKGKKLERKAKIAAGAADESLIRRIETFDRDPTAVEGDEVHIAWQPRRGRVLTKWKRMLNDAGLDKKVNTLEADASLSDAAARTALVEQIHADLDEWRELGLQGK